MHRLLTLLRRRFGATAMLLIAGLAAASAQAALDTTALTTDHSVTVPTEWWIYENQSPQQLSDKLAEHGARIVGLEVTGVTGGGEPRFSARLVHNSGAYAVPGWGWYYDQTPEQISTLINANSARLIELERYDRGGGQIRYAAVLVSNTGAARRNWSWLLGVTATQIRNHIQSTVWRPIDLDAYGSDGARRYNAVFVHNSGDDYKAFEWDVDKDYAHVLARLESFQGRLTKLGRQSNGNWVFVQVKNTGSNATLTLQKTALPSMAAVENWARQLRARPVEFFRWRSGTTPLYAAVLVDNANADERRLRNRMDSFWDEGNNSRGIFSAYLKEVAGPVRIDFNGHRRAETASSLKLLHLLHAMRQVQLNLDALASDNFRYYDYYDGSDHEPKDRCPSSAQEGGGRELTSTLEWGLDRMMDDSDNRTTRGVVLRYGGFEPINATAAWAGLSGTTLRHNIGCAYFDPISSRYAPATLRNETTAADLARIFEGVWRSQLLTASNGARREFLESTRSGGAGGALTAIIYQEADRIGRSYAAAPFASLVKRWGKGGSYDTCLGSSSDSSRCGESVVIRSSVGLIELPVMNGGYIGARRFVHAALISDVPSAWASSIGDEFSTVRAELFRTVIREALLTW